MSAACCVVRAESASSACPASLRALPALLPSLPARSVQPNCADNRDALLNRSAAAHTRAADASVRSSPVATSRAQPGVRRDADSTRMCLSPCDDQSAQPESETHPRVPRRFLQSSDPRHAAPLILSSPDALLAVRTRALIDLPTPTMSNVKQNNTEGSVASRTRTRIRALEDGDEEKQPAAPSSVHVSPAMRIYRHALESIFAMLELADLSRILAVSRSWSAAVRSMAPISGSIERNDSGSIDQNRPHPLPPVESIIASPLLRHLTAIHISEGDRWAPPTNASLALLSQHAPNLSSLRCELILTQNEPLVFPAKLQSLNLRLLGEYTDAVIDGVLATLAALPFLSQLSLRVSAFHDDSAVNLNLLAACPSLIDLALEASSGCSPRLSEIQVHQIRSSLGHLRRLDVGDMDPDMLARYLKPPVTVRWQDIGFAWADERTGDCSSGCRR